MKKLKKYFKYIKYIKYVNYLLKTIQITLKNAIFDLGYTNIKKDKVRYSPKGVFYNDKTIK